MKGILIAAAESVVPIITLKGVEDVGGTCDALNKSIDIGQERDLDLGTAFQKPLGAEHFWCKCVLFQIAALRV